MASNFLNQLMGASVNVTLPNIEEEFSMSVVGLSWVSMSILLATAFFLVPLEKSVTVWNDEKCFCTAILALQYQVYIVLFLY